MSIMKNKQEILDSVRENPDMMTILTIIRDLELTDTWLAAGSVRNFIWNLLSDRPAFDLETDVDVIFFDPDISYAETLSLEKKLREGFPQYQWELKNQVYMHQHSPHTSPYTSSRDAMSKYPERCTAIGLRLNEELNFELYAPYGLEDILNFQVRPTPHFLENDDRMKLYQQRLSKKNWQEKWKNLIFKNT
ncbi:nucleotidyltransferase family protein [Streptococcus mitis]|uniref:nucleotidyltransferase family protein n=1 Tax=Streptococcus TaxID=1301 RepID=UPI00066B901E|nr:MULTISPECIES: nucleotidyltransferase family protein [Streptococcus]MBW3454248.1 nucleotidyltransferase family protein [Streptococcus mitis]